MTIDEFAKGFSSLCNYLFKFSAGNYEKLHVQTLSRSLPLAVGASTLASMLTLTNQSTILVSNINVVLFNLFSYFNEHFLNSNKVKIKIDTIPIIKLISDLISNKLKNVNVSAPYSFEEEDITILDFILEKIQEYNNTADNASISEFSELKRKLAEFEKAHSQNLDNHNFNSRAHKLDNLSEDFELSRTLLLSEIENRLTCINHISTFDLHLKNKTVPSSLFYNRFPYPMFDRDSEFVNQFNSIIHDCQVKMIDLCSSHCKAKVDKHDSNISKIIDKYKNTHDMDNIYKDSENRIADKLKDKFIKSASKVSSYTPRGYLPKNGNSTPNSSPPRKRLNFDNNRSQFNHTPSSNRRINTNDNQNYNSQPSYHNNNSFRSSNNNNHHYNRNNKRQRSRSHNNRNSRPYIRDRASNNNNQLNDGSHSSNNQVFDNRNRSNQYV